MTINGRNGSKSIRILLVGEDGVGKTSLVTSLLSEEFHSTVPARMDEVIIPPDVTPEKVPTHIVDFSTQDQNEEMLFDELRRSNAVCIVYAVDWQASIDRITTYWLPTIQKVLGVDHGRPVILVGNKSDDTDTSTMDQILPIMNKYPEIETCVECSAKTLKNISELFYYAQKAVLHPTGPLYIPEDKEICDHDNDGLLNDYELNEFQKRCFNIPLTPQALSDVKTVVQRALPEGVLGNALTLQGFLYLHTLFIQRGRHETTWTVLRKFGYNNSLQLSQDYLYPPLEVPRGCSVELSDDGFLFLTALFEKYDEDKDGCLSPTELANLFSVCPAQPWGPDVANTVATNENGWITYNGYMAYWAFTTLLDTPRTLEYLAYLGYVNNYRNQTAALQVMRDKRIDWQKHVTFRNTFICHVIGPKDVGKTTFMQGLLGRNIRQVTSINRRHLSNYTINTVSVHGEEKHLILHEIDVLTPEDYLSAWELSCDVVCLMYDASNPHSFEYSARLYAKYFHRSRVPCLFVATKADRSLVAQDFELQPEQFCERHRLPPPRHFAADESPELDVYNELAELAAEPHRKFVTYSPHSLSSATMTLTVATAALLVAGFAVYKGTRG